MSDDSLHCEQAIFTSIRTPTGEGYRVVSASGGLRPEDKQLITRMSPSHDALCAEHSETDTEVAGVSFYAMPREQVCVGISRFAGAEHTGRGGMRVYTYNLIFDARELACVGFNPFVIVRSAVAAGLTDPQLKPAPMLPEVDLPVGTTFENGLPRSDSRNGLFLLTGPWRIYALNRLLEGESILLNLPHGWLAAAETLLLGIPGPMRAGLSFSAGLKFSSGRTHRLALTKEDARATRSRLAGRPIEFFDPTTAGDPPPLSGEWLQFVEHHWSEGNFTQLAARTSQPFARCDYSARERLAEAFNAIDHGEALSNEEQLQRIESHLSLTSAEQTPEVAEREIATELCDRARQRLMDRFARGTWSEIQSVWPHLCELWRRTDASCAFLQPLVEKGLAVAGAVHAAVAAEAALEITLLSDYAEVRLRQVAFVDRVLACLGDWAQKADDGAVNSLPGQNKSLSALVSRWNQFRGRFPAVDQLQSKVSAKASTG